VDEGGVILLDTNALLWLASEDKRLGSRSREVADAALGEDELAVSAILFCEVAALAVLAKIKLGLPMLAWRQDLLDRGLREWPVDGEIAIRAVELRSFHKDPGDRLIVATALVSEAVLITSDAAILAWPGPLHRLDARR
jgi:PIN domain nuclease of toxin-antitoxin system